VARRCQIRVFTEGKVEATGGEKNEKPSTPKEWGKKDPVGVNGRKVGELVMIGEEGGKVGVNHGT